MPPTIWWVRRDLRLHDNVALHAALAHGEPVIPVFVLDPTLLAAPDAGAPRVAFMFGGLAALDADLRSRGSRLIVRQGDPAEELARLVAETGAAGVCAEADPWPYARERDARVAERVPLTLTQGLTARPYDGIVKADGAAYTVFTPFSRAWKALPLPRPADLLPAPEQFAALPDLPGLPIPGAGAAPSALFPPGEREAQRRLGRFVRGQDAAILRYDTVRNRMDLPGTSQLSPYLRFGMVSARAAAAAAVAALAHATTAEAQKGAETWLNELIWREFYQTVLYRHPGVLNQEFQAGLRDIRWRNDPAEFTAWCEGRTGISRGGCRDAPARADRVDAQPGPDDHRVLPGQRPADRLAVG